MSFVCLFQVRASEVGVTFSVFLSFPSPTRFVYPSSRFGFQHQAQQIQPITVIRHLLVNSILCHVKYRQMWEG